MEKTLEVAEYETPEVFELGEAETLTQHNLVGDWPETIGTKFTFAP